MLNAQLSRLENYPELSERIRLHIKETKAQAALLTTVLDGHDEGSSTMKHAGGKLMAMAQSLSGALAGDEVMKGSLA
jgi:ferritin-like metal-binding protein YciE